MWVDDVFFVMSKALQVRVHAVMCARRRAMWNRLAMHCVCMCPVLHACGMRMFMRTCGAAGVQHVVRSGGMRRNEQLDRVCCGCDWAPDGGGVHSRIRLRRHGGWQYRRCARRCALWWSGNGCIAVCFRRRWRRQRARESQRRGRRRIGRRRAVAVGRRADLARRARRVRCASCGSEHRDSGGGIWGKIFGAGRCHRDGWYGGRVPCVVVSEPRRVGRVMCVSLLLRARSFPLCGRPPPLRAFTGAARGCRSRARQFRRRGRGRHRPRDGEPGRRGARRGARARELRAQRRRVRGRGGGWGPRDAGSCVPHGVSAHELLLLWPQLALL